MTVSPHRLRRLQRAKERSDALLQDELRPCRCGATTLVLLASPTSTRWWLVQCPACGLRGRAARNKAAAKERWETRRRRTMDANALTDANEIRNDIQQRAE